MGATIRVIVDAQQALESLDKASTKIPENLKRQLGKLADDSKKAWQEGTPEGKTKRLRGGEEAEVTDLSINFINEVYYYKFVDDGHYTPRGWHTKHGYRPAKRRSFVEGREMTKKATEFIEGHADPYLSDILDF
jgi:hypothetical protein